MTYPSGRLVTYVRDAQGRVSEVTTTLAGVTGTVASAITHLPFGGIASYTLGNGIAVVKSHDLDYRLAEQHDGGVQHRINHYDTRNNLEAIEDVLSPDRSQVFSYDALS